MTSVAMLIEEWLEVLAEIGRSKAGEGDEKEEGTHSRNSGDCKTRGRGRSFAEICAPCSEGIRMNCAATFANESDELILEGGAR
ncbi:MAG: hypothetical protein ACJA16_003556 [Akkermansiaceae bacterium]|jgi:hypothetical protein